MTDEDLNSEYAEETYKPDEVVIQEVIPYTEDELIDSLKEEEKPKKPVKKKQISWQLYRK